MPPACGDRCGVWSALRGFGRHCDASCGCTACLQACTLHACADEGSVARFSLAQGANHACMGRAHSQPVSGASHADASCAYPSRSPLVAQSPYSQVQIEGLAADATAGPWRRSSVLWEQLLELRSL